MWVKFYEDEAKPLHELMTNAVREQGATLLIPDLQRPYVWQASKIILLVDSLIRGWPFGNLLLWKVKSDQYSTIPSRPFWKIVDRTGESEGTQISSATPPNDFYMVLDGQQRLQSLLLAFGGENWGIKQSDRDWAKDFEI